MYIHCVYVLYLGEDEDTDRLKSSLSVLIIIEEIRNKLNRTKYNWYFYPWKVLGVLVSIHISPKSFESAQMHAFLLIIWRKKMFVTHTAKRYQLIKYIENKIFMRSYNLILYLFKNIKDLYVIEMITCIKCNEKKVYIKCQLHFVTADVIFQRRHFWVTSFQ